jgi:hypothetical protein
MSNLETLISGETNFDPVRNQNRRLFQFYAGEAIPAGMTVVAVFGAFRSSSPCVVKAQPNNEKKSRRLYFSFAAAAADQKINVIESGVYKMDTSGSAVGARVFLIADGAVSLTPPTAMKPIVVGIVIKVGAIADGGMVLLDNSIQAEVSETPAGAPLTVLDIEFAITNGTTGSPYSFTLPTGHGRKLKLIEANVECGATDAGGTAQVTNSAGTAITNAMACATNDAKIYASSIAAATKTQDAGATVKVAYAGGSSAGRGTVRTRWAVIAP